MKFIPVLCVIISVIILIFLGCLLFKKLKASHTAKKILKYAKRNEQFATRLVCSVYPKKNIFNNVFLPTTQNSRGFCECDIILVNKAGVFCIEVKGMKGFIDNPVSSGWCQFHHDKVLSFQNPFEQNAYHLRAIAAILKREHIPNVPLYNVVVFTDSGVKFKYRIKNLLTAENLLPYLHDKSREHFLSRSEITQVISVIRRYRIRFK